MDDRSYRKLKVWQLSMNTVEQVYNLTQQLPNDEKYGLKSQLQRASVSVPANTAEGYGRLHRGDYIRHLSIARGSLFEVETLLTIVVKLKLTSREQVIPIWQQLQETGRMLTGMIRKLKQTKQETGL